MMTYANYVHHTRHDTKTKTMQKIPLKMICPEGYTGKNYNEWMQYIADEMMRIRKINYPFLYHIENTDKSVTNKTK